MLNIPTTEERLGRSPRHIVRYFTLFMALVYAGMGAWLVWTVSQPASPVTMHFAQIGLTGNRLRLLGLVFVIYGLVRFVRSYRANFRPSSSDTNDISLR
jgi:TRAP-type C4-dicarboxylate transport system permease small subunit